jgi:hypothetical protein
MDLNKFPESIPNRLILVFSAQVEATHKKYGLDALPSKVATFPYMATCALMDDTSIILGEIPTYSKMSMLAIITAVAWLIPAVLVSW